MRYLLSMFAILGLVVAITGCKKEDPDKTVTVYSMVGDVKVVAAGKEKTAAVGDVLAAGDSIRTGANSIADILFGTAGIMRIQPGSNVSVASIMDPSTGNSQLNMPEGKITVTLSKLKKGTFSVKTPTAVASVRGTTFRVTAGEKASRLDVISGTVTVNPVQNDTVVPGAEKTVATNQTVELDEKTVKQVVAQKKEITVTELKTEEIKKIKDEVKDIKPEMLEKLNNDARQEIKEKVLAPDDSADREKREKEEKAKKEKDRALNLLQEKKAREEKGIEKAKPMKQETDNKPKEKTRDESKGTPSGLQTL